MTIGYPTALAARFGAKATIYGVPYAIIRYTGREDIQRPFDWVFPIEHAEMIERGGYWTIVERWMK